jgi:hypothetical protein
MDFPRPNAGGASAMHGAKFFFKKLRRWPALGPRENAPIYMNARLLTRRTYRRKLQSIHSPDVRHS